MKKYILMLVVILLCSVGYGATITASGSGDWSAGGTWTGGTAPGIGDTADLNGFTVTFDTGVAGQHIQCDAITSPASAGQLLIPLDVLGDSTITCTAGITAGTTIMLSVTEAAPAATLTVNSDIAAGAGSSDVGLFLNSSGSVIVVGNVTGGGGSLASGVEGFGTSGSITITGVVTGGSGSANGVRWRATTGVLTINGNVIGGSSSTGHGVILENTATDVFINGDITAATGQGLQGLTYTGTCTIVGDVAGSPSSSSAEGIFILSGSGDYHITGNVTADLGIGIEHDGEGDITIIGNVTGSNTAAGRAGLDVFDSGVGIVIVTGTVTGGSQSTSVGIGNGDNPLAVNGNIIAGAGAGAMGVRQIGTGPLIVNGDVTGGVGSGSRGISTEGNSPVTVVGDVYAGDGVDSPGIFNAGTETVTITGSIIHGQAGDFGLALIGHKFVATPDPGDFVQFGVASEFTAAGGAADFPDVGNVLTRDTVDSVQGTYEPALVGDHQLNVTYGTDGTEFTGTFVVPTIDQVLKNIQYGAGGTEFTGVLTAGGGGPRARYN